MGLHWGGLALALALALLGTLGSALQVTGEDEDYVWWWVYNWEMVEGEFKVFKTLIKEKKPPRVRPKDYQTVVWGRNDFKQLGIEMKPENANDEIDTRIPLVVAKFSGAMVRDLTCSEFFCFAAVAHGMGSKIYSWGFNEAGQLGFGDNKDRPQPTQVPGLKRKTIVQISLGRSHGMALVFGGPVYLWGANWHGQLGMGNKINNITRYGKPSTNLLQDLIAAIAAGGDHNLALSEDGKVYAWGSGGQGQLGHGRNEDVHTPVPVVTTGYNIIRVAAGDSHSLALTSAGEVLTWGMGDDGCLGHGYSTNDWPRQTWGDARDAMKVLTPEGDTVLHDRPYQLVDADLPQPAKIMSLKKLHITAIYPGPQQTFAVTDDLTVYSWGSNADGLTGLGLPNGGKIDAPRKVDALCGRNWTEIAVGLQSGAAIDDKGDLYTWGAADLLASGEEPEGVHGNVRNVPMKAETISERYFFQQVSCGTDMCIASGYCLVQMDVCNVCGGDNTTCVNLDMNVFKDKKDLFSASFMEEEDSQGPATKAADQQLLKSSTAANTMARDVDTLPPNFQIETLPFALREGIRHPSPSNVHSRFMRDQS